MNFGYPVDGTRTLNGDIRCGVARTVISERSDRARTEQFQLKPPTQLDDVVETIDVDLQCCVKECEINRLNSKEVLVKGRGGVQGQKIFFSDFVICCSPTHGLSKMGSLSSQLPTVAEI